MQHFSNKRLIHHSEILDSTNTEALRHSEQAVDGEVWVANFQQLGRGQQSNTWESEAGKNLLFSIFLRPHELEAGAQFRLSQVVSLALCDVLREYGVKAVIKWPNDIYVGRKKIAGILIEQHIMGAYVSLSVAGIGLNVNQTVFRSSAPNPTSMCLEAGCDFDKEEVLSSFLACFDRRYAQLHTNALMSDYMKLLLFYDEWSDYEADGMRFSGKITGVCPTGELCLEGRSGEVSSYVFKEISFCL